MKEWYVFITKFIFAVMMVCGIIHMIQSIFNHNQLDFIQGLLMVVAGFIFGKDDR